MERKNPLTGPIRFELRPQVRKIQGPPTRGHCISKALGLIARRARLEAREAGFLVLNEALTAHIQVVLDHGIEVQFLTLLNEEDQFSTEYQFFFHGKTKLNCLY